MPTTLQEVGAPEVGFSFSINRQVTPGGGDNRIITRRKTIRLADLSNYTVAIQRPTLYDALYPNAVIVDQRVEVIPNNKSDANLIREFAEVPTEWDEPDDRIVPFPGVARSSLYNLDEFNFRNGQVSLRTDVRVNRRYFLGEPEGIPRYIKFRVTDAYGMETSVITDYTLPSVDEWIAMVAGRQEVVQDSKVVPWKGWIHCLETTFVVAK